MSTEPSTKTLDGRPFMSGKDRVTERMRPNGGCWADLGPLYGRRQTYSAHAVRPLS